jgi:site-specific DNA-methyltransferase (adenine-specific)
LRDLFGLPPYRALQLFDLRDCAELQPRFIYTNSQTQELQAIEPVPSQLLNGDCLEQLRRIPDNSIDFCFADPPYNLQKKYDSWDDSLELVKYFAWCDEWLSELYRVLKPGHTLAVLNIPQWAARHYQHLSTFARFQNWLAWDGLSYPVRQIMPSHYGILCMSKSKPRPLPGLAKTVRGKQDAEALAPLAEFYCLRSDCISRRAKLGHNDRDTVSDLWHDVHRLKHNSRRVDHPCQLPPLLMRRLYALFTQPGEIVLDCFNGAGTSTLVAQQMGRRYVGIEISEKYHELAVQRHQKLTQGEDPFAKGDIVPQAKNSPLERLPKQKYKVSKKVLQLDVKRIAQHLGRLPSRDEVGHLSRFPLEYFDNYFVSWGEVCAAARTTGMSETLPDKTIQQAQLSLFAS